MTVSDVEEARREGTTREGRGHRSPSHLTCSIRLSHGVPVPHVSLRSVHVSLVTRLTFPSSFVTFGAGGGPVAVPNETKGRECRVTSRFLSLSFFSGLPSSATESLGSFVPSLP